MPPAPVETPSFSAPQAPRHHPVAEPAIRRFTPWILAAIGLLAFGLRWAAVAYHPQPGHYLHHDSQYYLDNARSILASGMPEDNEAPLGFSYILCLFLKAGAGVHFIGYFLQPLVGALNCILIYFLCRQLHRPNAGLAAALACAIHPTLINSSSQILTEPWANLCIMLTLIFTGTKKKSLLLLSGLIMGFACAIRSPCLALLVGLPVWWMMRDFSHGMKRALPFLAMALIPIMAASVHLSVTHHTPVFLTLQSREASFVKPVLEGFVELDPEQEKMRGNYFQYALHYPIHFLEERLLSMINFVSPWPFGPERSPMRKLLVAISDGSIVLTSFAAILVLWKRHRHSDWFVLVWLSCCLCLFYALFFSIPRYRVPVLPLLIAFSALALVPSRARKEPPAPVLIS